MVLYLTRKEMFYQGQSDQNATPGKECPGGGMNAKAWNVLRAIDTKLIGSISDATEIPGFSSAKCCILIDPLMMHPKGADPFQMIEEIAEFDALKILWAEEQELMRWTHQKRLMMIDAVDAVAVSNEYLASVFDEFGIDSSVLYTPIDSTFYKPAKTKKPHLVGLGQVSYAKNIPDLIELFKAVNSSSAELETVFVGGSELWGQPGRETDRALEKELGNNCTHIKSASRADVAEILGEAWGFVSMTRYDVGSLSFLESATSGCHCFGWYNHPQFDEYKSVNRFEDSKNGAETIIEKYSEVGNSPDNSIRTEVSKKHSFNNFQKALDNLIGDIYRQFPKKQDDESDEYHDTPGFQKGERIESNTNTPLAPMRDE